MDDPERRTAKRSRFDQTEPEPKRASRFDRRSRSPPPKRPNVPRERSPVPKEGDGRKPLTDPSAAAAAAAARINAQLQARKGIQHIDVPPIKSSLATSDVPPGSPTSSKDGGVNGEMYVADGDYIKDIEVNDLRNRYVLTRGSTRQLIQDETGADVTTRGSYYPDKSMATPTNPPLYLHITSTTKEGLEKAVAKIEELMKQDLPTLVDERRFRRRDQEVERDEFGRRKWPEEKIPINLEPIPGFNLRAQVVGHGGAYVKHIQQETGCRVQIKGRGSGYLEQATNRESDEDMFLHVAGPDAKQVEKAKELCEDLVGNVKEQYERHKSQPARSYGARGGYADQPAGGSHGNSYQGYGNSYQTPSGATSSGSVPTSGSPPGATDYAAHYAQYYGGQDPYAAYGGYAAYVQWYQQYYASAQTQQAAGASPPPPPSEAPPPPPPSGSAPPPPPPPSAAPPGGSGYSSVPPPPGL